MEQVPGRLIITVQIVQTCNILHTTACLHELLFKTGPIPLINVHHYACQLFDALDFLHNQQGIIHCDIKRQYDVY